ncbi:MAG: RodZ domain-containing protein [Candidatus Omnitrophota bacterium]
MAKVSIGSQLKKAREKKEIAISEVYQQTKIHPDVLSALEEDRFDNILNPIYVRGFLKRYAAYLGLDADIILDQYNELGKKEKQTIKESEVPRKNKKGKTFKLPDVNIPRINFDKGKIKKAAKFLAIIIAALFVVFLFIKTTVFVAGKASQKLSQLAKESDSKKAADSIKPKLIEKSPPKKAETPASVIKKVEAAVSAPKKKEAAKEEPKEVLVKQDAVVSIPQQESLKLTIRAAEDAWIQLKVDGKIIFQNVLSEGSAETWKADKNFEIWTGRAEAMYLNLNGNDLGVLGSGVKKGIVVDRRGIRR